MSRQEMVAYGKQEFRRYPLVTLDPLPGALSVQPFIRHHIHKAMAIPLD